MDTEARRLAKDWRNPRHCVQVQDTARGIWRAAFAARQETTQFQQDARQEARRCVLGGGGGVLPASSRKQAAWNNNTSSQFVEFCIRFMPRLEAGMVPETGDGRLATKSISLEWAKHGCRATFAVCGQKVSGIPLPVHSLRRESDQGVVRGWKMTRRFSTVNLVLPLKDTAVSSSQSVRFQPAIL